MCRFLDTEEVNFINDKKTYSRWVNFWEKKIADSTIHLPRRSPVNKSDSAFIEEIMETQKDNYILLEGGILIDEIRADELDDAVDFLFEEIIAHPHSEGEKVAQADQLRIESEHIFKQTDLWNRHDFYHGTKGFSVPCRVHDVWKDLRFDYAIANGNPQAVFHKVDLNRDSSWERAAFKFGWLLESAKLDKSRCGALVHISKTSQTEVDEEYQKTHEIISGYANIINVADEREAIKYISEIAKGL